jgi:hypothetical protein
MRLVAKFHRSASIAAVLAAWAALQPSAASAETASEARLREALRTTTAQLRAAEDDRARLQASEAALKEELAKVKADAARRAAPRVGGRELEELRAKTAETAQRLAEQAEGNRKLTDALAQCQAGNQDATRGKADAEGELRGVRERLAAAEATNARMYAVGKDVFDWLSRLGFGTALRAREPFLGLKRVELENAAQDYEDKLYEQRLHPGAPAPQQPAVSGASPGTHRG